MWHADWVRLLRAARRVSSHHTSAASASASAPTSLPASMAPRLLRLVHVSSYHAHAEVDATVAAASAGDSDDAEYAPPPTLAVFSPLHAAHVWCTSGGGASSSSSSSSSIERALVCVDIETERACAVVPLRHAPRALAVSPDGCALAVGGGARYIVMVDARTGDAEEIYGAADAVRCVAFSASGAALVCGAANEVHIFSG